MAVTRTDNSVRKEVKGGVQNAAAVTEEPSSPHRDAQQVELSDCELHYHYLLLFLLSFFAVAILKQDLLN